MTLVLHVYLIERHIQFENRFQPFYHEVAIYSSAQSLHLSDKTEEAGKIYGNFRVRIQKTVLERPLSIKI